MRSLVCSASRVCLAGRACLACLACLACIVWLAVCALVVAGCSRRERKPNVVLVTLDTTRADRLSCYGHRRKTSPRLDGLAAESLRFTRAYAVTSWTLPSHASIFTGKFPSSHGAQYDENGALKLSQALAGARKQSMDGYRVRTLSPEERTLAGLLSANGWKTCGVAGGPWTKKLFGLDLGFDVYDDENLTSINGRPGDDVTRAGLEFVRAHRDQPFFVFLNYFDAHEPNRPSDADVQAVLAPGESIAELDPAERLRVQYEAEIFAADRALGVFLDGLRELGLYDDTWIVVVGDHGQLLGESFLGGEPLGGHGYTLSQGELLVPLVIKAPGSKWKGVADTPVQQVDVLPLLCAELDLPLPAGVQGEVPVVDGVPRAVSHPIVAELYPLEKTVGEAGADDWRLHGDWRVIVEGPLKYSWHGKGRHALVDLERDPGELVNVIDARRAEAQALEVKLTRFLDALPPPLDQGAAGEIDAKTAEELKQLGYLGDH
ncbi:MAG: sulfatase [Planctomycetes bacterium]|nr:sulfatase [Planctomycetota bacterium]